MNALHRLPAIVAIASVVAAANVPVAQAETARGCRGELQIMDRPLGTAHAQFDLIATFEGRGTCKNRTQADKCRKRAADAIIRCAREMWSTRNSERLPPSCVQTRGNSIARTRAGGR